MMWFRIGLIAILLSFVSWLAILGVPFLGLQADAKVAVVAALAILAEVLFWAGLALAGKDTWQAIRSYGWRRAPGRLIHCCSRGDPSWQSRSQSPGKVLRCLLLRSGRQLFSD
jgi:hypothetical protein